MSQTIICPNCETNIDLDKIADQKYSTILKEQENKLKDQQEEQRKAFDKQLENEKIEMREKAKSFAEEQVEKERKKVEFEMKDMQQQLKEANKDREESKKLQLEILKKAREIEKKEKNFELEMEKQLFEEKKKIEENISKKLEDKSNKQFDEKVEEIQEQNRKKELEMLKQQEQMKKTIDDLKRKSEQASQQIQWDIQEDHIKDVLKNSFPIDNIDDVATWVKWADLIQTVKNNIWISNWIIVWESKNTKTWSDSWIMKLKEDKLKVKWNIAILVTAILPKWIENFWMVDDVMICLPKYVVPVASMLREKLIAVAKMQKALEWKDIKMEMLYRYLSSEEFSSKIWMMVDVFSQLKIWIDSEKRAMEKNWKKREKDLERATFAVTGMYWELESLMWQELPWSEKLSLNAWE